MHTEGVMSKFVFGEAWAPSSGELVIVTATLTHGTIAAAVGLCIEFESRAARLRGFVGYFDEAGLLAIADLLIRGENAERHICCNPDEGHVADWREEVSVSVSFDDDGTGRLAFTGPSGFDLLLTKAEAASLGRRFDSWADLWRKRFESGREPQGPPKRLRQNTFSKSIKRGSFWVDANGNHPVAFTQITLDDIEAGRWVPKDGTLTEQAKGYVQALGDKFMTGLRT
jgi:hypothetical protein